MANSRVREVLNRLAREETRFLTRQFLAPVVPGGEVWVRIARVLCKLYIEPAETGESRGGLVPPNPPGFQGWAVCQPITHTHARVLRSATLTEQRQYLHALPLVRLILIRSFKRCWLALRAHQHDQRFHLEGEVPVYGVEDGQRFDVVRARFDGRQFWFECLEHHHDPIRAHYLRQALHKEQVPEQLHCPGLTPEERLAYTLNYQRQLQARRGQTHEQLAQALTHAGGQLHNYQEHELGYRVEYEVDGERHISLIGGNDLTVRSAGICLDGEDEKFDLQSLVSVLREAQAF